MESNFHRKYQSFRSEKQCQGPYKPEPVHKWIEVNMLEGRARSSFVAHKTEAIDKAFLLFENLDQSTWTKTLQDSRSACTSLREHFLRHIEHPDDLSEMDPLTEDRMVSGSIL